MQSRPLRSAANRAQDNQAVGVDADKHAKDGLIRAIAHEVAEDARRVLCRGWRKCDNGNRECHARTVIIELAMVVSMPLASRAFHTRIQKWQAAPRLELIRKAYIQLDETHTEHDSCKHEHSRYKTKA